MPTGTTKIILTGENARAVKAINEVATASEKAAAKSSSAFDKSTSKVGGAFQKLDRTLGSFGIPFTGALGVMGSKLEDTGKRSKGLKDNLSALGGGIALGAAAGFALIGGAAVKAALAGEKAHAQLVVAIKNAGQTEQEFGGKIDATSKHMADFGFQNDEVETSIARLTTATHDTAKAIELQGLAADIAAGRHISLEEATSILVKVESGHVGALGRLGIATKDATGKTISQEEAEKKLASLYKGAAGAAADTYAGKIAALSAKTQNLVEELGNKLIPVVETGVTGILSTVDAFDSANSATGGWLGKIALAGAAVPVAVFAIDKLAKAGSAVVGAYGKVGDAIGKTISAVTGATTANEALTVSTVELSTAEEVQAVAAANAAAATVTAGAAADAAVLGTGAAAEAAGVTATVSLSAAIVPLGVIAVGAVAAGAAAYGLSKAFDAIFGSTKPLAADADKVKELAAELLKAGDAAKKAQSALGGQLGTVAAADLKKYSDELLSNADAQALNETEANTLTAAHRELAVRFFGTADAAKLSDREITDAAAGHGTLATAVERSGNSTQTFSNALGQQDRAVHGATDSLDELKKKYGEAAIQNAQLSEAQKEYADLLASGSASDEALAAAHDKVVTASRAQHDTQIQVTAATDEGTKATGTATEADKARADAAKKVDDALAKLGEVAGESAVKIVSGSHLSADAIDNITSAVKSMNTAAESAFDGAGSAVDHFKDKTNIGFQDVQKYMLTQLGNTEKWANNLSRLADLGLNQGLLKKLNEAGPSSAGFVQTILDNVKNGSVKSLNALADAGDKAEANFAKHLAQAIVDAETAVARWNAALARTRAEVRTKLIIEEQGYSDAITKLRTITNLAAYGQTAIVTFTGGGTGAGGQYHAKAAGGPVSAGSPYVVGEKGPELFVPSTAGMIVPNGATGTRGGYAAVTNINIYASGIGDRELGRQVVQALREYQRTRGPLNLKIAG